MSLRLTMIAPSLSAGGTERAVVALAHGLQARGCQVTVISFTAPADDHFELNPAVRREFLAFYQVVAWWRRPWAALQRLWHLRRKVQSTQPDVVLSLSDRTNIRLVLALLGSSCKIVLGERSNPHALKYSKLWEWLRKVCYRSIATLVVQSDGVADWARGIGVQRVVKIPNSVPAWPVATRQPRPLHATGRTVVSLGRLAPEKGLDVLLAAWQAIPQRPQSWRLLIGGEGPERARLGQLAQDQSQVEFVGLVNDVPEFLAQADLLVLPSRYEGFPNVLLEALHAGVPVIASDCEFGPRDIVREDVDGVLVPVDDVASLVAALSGLLNDTARLRRYAENSREVAARFDPEDGLTRWLEVLQNAGGTDDPDCKLS
ncbi:MAG: glycosyltransferase family 4 protein [Pseudomonadota bacterium]